MVDLYEIEKMRKLHLHNTQQNKGQLKNRKDGANASCVVSEPILPSKEDIEKAKAA